MYKSIITMALLGGISATAMANQGTIHFSGEITDAPCSITSDNEDQTVRLGQISQNALLNGGTSQVQQFNITVADCRFSEQAPAGRTAVVTFTGTSNEDLDGLALTGFTNDNALAENVTIDIKHNNDSIVLGTPIDFSELQTGDNVLPFTAQVRGAPTATVDDIPLGNFSSLANFSITYN